MRRTQSHTENGTRNDLAPDLRARVAERLNARLADAIDLGAEVKQAHWSVKGHNFIALHELFDKVAADAQEYTDLIAERVTQLGGIAAGSLRTVVQRSTLPEFPATATDWRECTTGVAAALSAFARAARADIDWSAEAGDAVTADILTEIVRGVDKWLWFVESHLDER